MKIFIVLSLTFLLISGHSYAQSGDSNQQTPELAKSDVSFKETIFNFKTVDFNSDVSHSFIFTNTSHAPVSINRVTPSCGCTTTDYTKGPIMPAKTGFVSIKYDSTRPGYFSKSVTVVIGEESYTLIFLGTVQPNPNEKSSTPQNTTHY